MKLSPLRILALATGLGLLLGLVAWMVMPRTYAATTLLADERGSMTIAVGMDEIVSERSKPRSLDDPDVYRRILESPDFLAALGTDRLRYQHDLSAGTLLLCADAQDPEIAVAVCDSATRLLQRFMAERLQAPFVMREKAFRKAVEEAQDECRRAREAYADFVDTHRNAVSESVLAEQERLDNVYKESNRALAEATERHTRALLQLDQAPRPFSVLRSATMPLAPASPLLPVCLVTGLFCGLLVGAACILMRSPRSARHLAPDLGGVFSPWVITPAVWSVILLLICFEGDRLYPLNAQFYVSLTLWAGLLCASALITYRLLPGAPDAVSARPLRVSGDEPVHACGLLFDILFVLSMVMSPLYAWEVYKVVSQFSATDMLNNIRLLAVHGSGVGWLKYTVVINQALFLVAVWGGRRIGSWRIALIVLANILCAIAIMEKGALFTLVICSVFVLIEKRRVRPATLGVVSVVLVVAFYLFNVARETTSARSGAEMGFLDFLTIYITSPSVAFGTCVRDLSGQIGVNTFEVFYGMLSRFDIGNFAVHNNLQQFVMVPVPTNVYTVMQPFYVDFGYGGVAFFAVVYGVLTGGLYRGHVNGHALSRVLYTYLVSLLILQFYQEALFFRFSAVTQLIILLALLTQQTFTLQRRY